MTRFGVEFRQRAPEFFDRLRRPVARGPERHPCTDASDGCQRVGCINRMPSKNGCAESAPVAGLIEDQVGLGLGNVWSVFRYSTQSPVRIGTSSSEQPFHTYTHASIPGFPSTLILRRRRTKSSLGDFVNPS